MLRVFLRGGFWAASALVFLLVGTVLAPVGGPQLANAEPIFNDFVAELKVQTDRFDEGLNSQVPGIPEDLKPGEYIKNIIPMRQRVQIMERALRWKKEHFLPMVMREQGIDLWIIRNDEADLYYNNEGPVYTSLLPADFQGIGPSQHERSRPPGYRKPGIAPVLVLLRHG